MAHNNVLEVLALLALVGLAPLPGSFGGKYFKSFAGPYWVSMIKFNECPERKDMLATLTMRFLNIPKTPTEGQRLSANLTLLSQLADNVTTTLDLETWANNEWKKNAIAKMTFRRCGCSCLRNFATDFSHQMFGIDPKSTGTCSLEKGSYTITNNTVDWEFKTFPEFIYGLYRGKLNIFLGKKIVFCGTVEVRVNPLAV